MSIVRATKFSKKTLLIDINQSIVREHVSFCSFKASDRVV